MPNRFSYQSQDLYYYHGNTSGSFSNYPDYSPYSGIYYRRADHQQTIIEPRQIVKEYMCAYCGSERENNKMKCKNCGATLVKEKEQPRVAPVTIIRKQEVDDAVVQAATKVKTAAKEIVNDTIDSWTNRIRRKLGI